MASLPTALYLTTPQGATTMAMHLGDGFEESTCEVFGVQVQWQLRSEEVAGECPELFPHHWVGTGLENWRAMIIKWRLTLVSSGKCQTAVGTSEDEESEVDPPQPDGASLAATAQSTHAPQLRLRKCEIKWLRNFVNKWQFVTVGRSARCTNGALDIDFDIRTPGPAFRIKIKTLPLDDFLFNNMSSDEHDLGEKRDTPLPWPFE